MTTAVVTPWLDHPELVADYEHALELGPWPDELFVVDNGSYPVLDGAAIRNEENQGFCRACNQGLERADTDVVVFLNNDVWATSQGWLAELVETVEPGVLVGRRLRTDPHCWVDGRVMPYLDGWCLAGSTDDLVTLGGFDEELEEPAYYSDNLLCLEARAMGMTLREARVGVHHKEGQTTSGTPDVAGASASNRRRYEQRARELLAHTTKGA